MSTGRREGSEGRRGESREQQKAKERSHFVRLSRVCLRTLQFLPAFVVDGIRTIIYGEVSVASGERAEILPLYIGEQRSPHEAHSDLRCLFIYPTLFFGARWGRESASRTWVVIRTPVCYIVLVLIYPFTPLGISVH